MASIRQAHMPRSRALDDDRNKVLPIWDAVKSARSRPRGTRVPQPNRKHTQRNLFAALVLVRYHRFVPIARRRVHGRQRLDMPRHQVAHASARDVEVIGLGI